MNTLGHLLLTFCVPVAYTY